LRAITLESKWNLSCFFWEQRINKINLHAYLWVLCD
jgi:hypothetical protein